MKKSDWTITVEAQEENMPVRGNAIASGDDMADKEIEDRIIEEYNDDNEWAWCLVAVTVRFRGCLEHTEYLGGCSYASRQDFIDHSGYYESMADECKRQIRLMRERLVKEIE